MERKDFYNMMNGGSGSDYETYLNTKTLFSCQKEFDQFCNRDELMFQVVHQVQELWMRVIGYTLLDIVDFVNARSTNRVLTLYKRVHSIQQKLISELSILETMSPKEYQEIRQHLGNGSGRNSPGFKALINLSDPLWQSFTKHYLEIPGLTIEKIYDTDYSHDDSYMIAEAMVEYDELFCRFRFYHLQLIERTIGLESKSLKGRPVDTLEDGMKQRLFPGFWKIRSQMTDKWGAEYGVIRNSLNP